LYSSVKDQDVVIDFVDLFGTDIVTNNKYDERFYGFTGIFSGEHIKGTHAYVVPGMP
jgi:hypothetical protein